MNNPLLSIITINYNNAEGLRKTLESVGIQDDLDFEHIIIDGGSTDSSVQIIEEYLKDEKYSKHITFWCSEKDKGIYNAMNKGISHATGKYVYILNSGDWLIPNVFKIIFSYLQQYQDCILYGAIDGYNGNDYAGTFSHTADELNKVMIPHQGVFIPLSIHKKYGLYDESYKICADREFVFRVKNKGENFVHIPIIVCNYNFEGISSKTTKAKNKENFRISNQFLSKKQIVLSKIRHFIRIFIQLMLPGFISIPMVSMIRKLKPTSIVE